MLRGRVARPYMCIPGLAAAVAAIVLINVPARLAPLQAALIALVS